MFFHVIDWEEKKWDGAGFCVTEELQFMTCMWNVPKILFQTVLNKNFTTGTPEVEIHRMTENKLVISIKTNTWQISDVTSHNSF